jgi:hypothetical protein
MKWQTGMTKFVVERVADGATSVAAVPPQAARRRDHDVPDLLVPGLRPSRRSMLASQALPQPADRLERTSPATQAGHAVE